MTNITYQISQMQQMPEYRNLEMMMWQYFPQSLYRINSASIDEDINTIYFSWKLFQRLLIKKELRIGNLKIILKEEEERY
jgi:hypothetical protein